MLDIVKEKGFEIPRLLRNRAPIPQSSAPCLPQPGYFITPCYSHELAKLRDDSKDLVNAMTSQGLS
jgi:hypothetical protein